MHTSQPRAASVAAWSGREGRKPPSSNYLGTMHAARLRTGLSLGAHAASEFFQNPNSLLRP
eukprot:6211816-Pleurochrysis_carterae.AAC.1